LKNNFLTGRSICTSGPLAKSFFQNFLRRHRNY